MTPARLARRSTSTSTSRTTAGALRGDGGSPSNRLTDQSLELGVLGDARADRRDLAGARDDDERGQAVGVEVAHRRARRVARDGVAQASARAKARGSPWSGCPRSRRRRRRPCLASGARSGPRWALRRGRAGTTWPRSRGAPRCRADRQRAHVGRGCTGGRTIWRAVGHDLEREVGRAVRPVVERKREPAQQDEDEPRVVHGAMARTSMHAAAWTCRRGPGFATPDGTRPRAPLLSRARDGERVRQRQRHDEGCAAEPLARPHHDRAVVLDDNLLHDGQAQAGALGLRREVRIEDALAGRSGTPGPSSSTMRSTPSARRGAHDHLAARLALAARAAPRGWPAPRCARGSRARGAASAGRWRPDRLVRHLPADSTSARRSRPRRPPR